MTRRPLSWVVPPASLVLLAHAGMLLALSQRCLSRLGGCLSGVSTHLALSAILTFSVNVGAGFLYVSGAAELVWWSSLLWTPVSQLRSLATFNWICRMSDESSDCYSSDSRVLRIVTGVERWIAVVELPR